MSRQERSHSPPPQFELPKVVQQIWRLLDPYFLPLSRGRKRATAHPLLLLPLVALALLLLLLAARFLFSAYSGPDGNSFEEASHVGGDGVYVKTSGGVEGEYEGDDDNKLAICMVGGARIVEVTAHSIFTQFFKVYSPADLFMYTNFDENAAKFPLLLSRLLQHQEAAAAAADAAAAGSGGGVNIPPAAKLKPSIRIQAVKIAPFMPVDVSRLPTEPLSKVASTGGLQGMFQQWKIIEGCWDLIVAHENQRQQRQQQQKQQQQPFRYEWIIKLRPDFFWNAAPPPLSSLPPDRHTVPDGRDYEGGLNDQFSIFPRALGEWSMRRLSFFPDAMAAYRPEKTSLGMTGEHVFRGQTVAGNISIHRAPFPYCLTPFRPLQHYRVAPYPFEGKTCTMLIFSIKSSGSLNGNYCGPCAACMDIQKAAAVLSSFPEDHSFHIGSQIVGNLPCDLSNESLPEFQNLHAAYLDAIGPEAAEEARAILDGANSFPDCVKAVEEVISVTQNWQGGSAADICSRAQLGRAKRGKPEEEVSYGEREVRPPFGVFARPWKLDCTLYVYENLRKVPPELIAMYTHPPQLLESFDSHSEELHGNDIYVPVSKFSKLKGVQKARFGFCQMYTTIRKYDGGKLLEKESLWRAIGMILESCQFLSDDILACTFLSSSNCLGD